MLIVTVSGPDRPGVLAALSQILVKHHVAIADMKQASLQNLLGLYFLLDVDIAAKTKDAVIKDLLFEASELGLSLDYQFVSSSEENAISQPHHHVLTHFGGTPYLAELSRILTEESVNIEGIASQTHHGARSVDMVIDVSQASSLARLKQRIMAKSRELNTDLAVQRVEAYRKNKRLIFFDMDSTLVDMEIIKAVCWVEELVRTLKWLGFKTGVVTGGFDFFSDYMKKKLGFDFAFANHLEIKNEELTGRVTGKIVDAAEKAPIVNQSACDEGVLLDQTVVVGDGANDALMLAQAGLGIAYNAKKRLDRVANVSLGKTRMAHVFHLLGITEEDIQAAAECKPQ
ncbi:MAG: HAD-IB family phosphatase [Deltaproteobacteria bacterium]|nr:HAD-IB family phosphatase [Deltaproteobacteria bacterium]